MKNEPLPELRTVLLLSRQVAHLAWLRDSLGTEAVVLDASYDDDSLLQQIDDGRVHALFVDCTRANEEAWRLAAIAADSHPELFLYGLGPEGDRDALMAAMRLKVADYIRTEADPAEVKGSIRQALTGNEVARPQRRRSGRIIAIVSGRPHAGASTITVNLVASLTRSVKDLDSLVLDFGAPVGDCLTYLGLAPRLSFAEGVQNLARCDRQFLRNGVSTRDRIGVLPMFSDPSEHRLMRTAEAFQFLGLLTNHYGLVAADLGGAESAPISDYVLRHADLVIAVCEQSVASLIAMQRMLSRVRSISRNTEHVALVVNRYDPAIALSPDYLAKTLGLPLWGTLPERRAALINATNNDRLAIDAASRDPWTKALDRIAPRVGVSLWDDTTGRSASSAGDSFWRRLMNNGSARQDADA